MALNDATFQVPLPQMLDLALGTPEVGSVNFNILHNFLHILLRQTSLNNAKAEYRGDNATRIKAMVESLKDGSNFYLHESDIIDMDGNIVQRDHIPDETVVTTNFFTIDDQVPQKNDGVDDNTEEEENFEDLSHQDEEKIKPRDLSDDKILDEEQIVDIKPSVHSQLVDDTEEIFEKVTEKDIHDNVDNIEMKSVGHVSADISADETEPFIDEVDIFSVESLSNSEVLNEDQSEYSTSRKSSKKPVSTASTFSKLDKDLIEKLKSNYEEDFKQIDSRVKILEQKLNFDGFEGTEGMQDVIKNIKNIETDIEKMNWIIENLNKEQKTRDINMDILTEQVMLLKTMKADREDLEDALASKADATVVNGKVSCNRFDTACEELTSALEDTILKSNQQETVLKEALDTVQQEIDSKLDKTEVSPIQEYMEEKLQALQDKLKELTTKNRENEATGAKKILTGLQCITCDRDVIMKREQNALDYPDPMPYRKSIKPYLTYKLDQTRKHQRQFPAKHINQFTAAVQEMNRHKFMTDNTMKKSSKDHFCNRYCGGSHTITTPQQRLMRMGHFLADWGPEIIQLTEGVVQGTDGQLYHGRPMPPGTTNVSEVCGLDENSCCNEKS